MSLLHHPLPRLVRRSESARRRLTPLRRMFCNKRRQAIAAARLDPGKQPFV